MKIPLLPCPFCGGEAEIYTGRTFPNRGKGHLASQIEALEKLDEYKKSGVVVRYSIDERKRARGNKWAIVVEMQAFIPRCRAKTCLGRTQIMFLTESEAASAWNGRASNREDT